jgi:hypothetical protein
MSDQNFPFICSNIRAAPEYGTNFIFRRYCIPKENRKEKNMEIVLDTWTTNKTNGSKYDSKIGLRGHHNRHHNAKLKMWLLVLVFRSIGHNEVPQSFWTKNVAGLLFEQFVLAGNAMFLTFFFSYSDAWKIKSKSLLTRIRREKRK